MVELWFNYGLSMLKDEQYNKVVTELWNYQFRMEKYEHN